MAKRISGTKEWAASNLNLKQNFCEHSCRYCYASAMAIRFGRATPESWGKPVMSRLPSIPGKRDGKIMFPSTHDITKSNIDQCIELIHRTLDNGNNMLIVSKPDPGVIMEVAESISSSTKDQVLFRFTIGSADNDVLKLWEPGAPNFEQRLESLKGVRELGFETSVSSEPMLDENIDEVVQKVIPYVTDGIWLGKANSLKARVSLNTGGDKTMLEHAARLDAIWSDKNVLDLYARYKDNPKVKWKESIKKIVGIKVPTVAGLDI